MNAKNLELVNQENYNLVLSIKKNPMQFSQLLVGNTPYKSLHDFVEWNNNKCMYISYIRNLYLKLNCYEQKKSCVKNLNYQYTQRNIF